MFHLSDYEYSLPDTLIAQYPLLPPEQARLLVYDRGSETIQDKHFFDLPTLLASDTALFFNNSHVIKARILFPNQQTEIFFLKAVSPYRFEALVRPGKMFKLGQQVRYTDDIVFTVEAMTDEGRLLSCNLPILEVLETYGQMPLPPYITYDETYAKQYQPTVADNKKPGSVAAPTAALHFSEKLLSELTNLGHTIDYVTLHVGLGTFKSVQTDDITQHQIHHELVEIETDIFEKIALYKQQKKPILAIGTTTTRTLESLPYLRAQLTDEQKKSIGTDATIAYRDVLCADIIDEKAKAYVSEIITHASVFTFHCALYIYPGCSFRVIDQLITNFHLPKSSLLMLVAGFVGYDQMRQMYTHAIEKQYRFFSFGDGSWIK